MIPGASLCPVGPPGLTQLDVPIEGEQNVASLDVPVDDAAAVQVLQCQQELPAGASDLLLTQRLLQPCHQHQ